MRGEADARAAKATRAVSDLQQEVRELAAAKGRLEARLRDSEVHALHARIQEMERSREVSVAESRLSHYPTDSGAGLLSDSDDDVSELSAETLLNELDVEFYEVNRTYDVDDTKLYYYVLNKVCLGYKYSLILYRGKYLSHTFAYSASTSKRKRNGIHEFLPIRLSLRRTATGLGKAGAGPGV